MSETTKKVLFFSAAMLLWTLGCQLYFRLVPGAGRLG